jgi:hypothetical protein
VIQQVIPDADMTSLERLLLSRIFDFEREGDGWYFFAPESPSMMITASRTELVTALASSTNIESAAHHYVTEARGSRRGRDGDESVPQRDILRVLFSGHREAFCDTGLYQHHCRFFVQQDAAGWIRRHGHLSALYSQ